MSKQPDTEKKTTMRLYGLLGLCKKAGKLRSGTDFTCEAVRCGTAKLALLAKNASQSTKKRIDNCCSYYQMQRCELPLSMDELAHAIGATMSIAAVAILDSGFAAAIIRLCNQPSTNSTQNQQEV